MRLERSPPPPAPAVAVAVAVAAAAAPLFSHLSPISDSSCRVTVFRSWPSPRVGEVTPSVQFSITKDYLLASREATGFFQWHSAEASEKGRERRERAREREWGVWGVVVKQTDGPKIILHSQTPSATASLKSLPSFRRGVCETLLNSHHFLFCFQKCFK